ncbi:diadenylate cyclase CdaA [candidate division WOR-3 bacterium]|nr:diadenylate cyclase CdaA [candidate division WOR-3 bacterium]
MAFIKFRFIDAIDIAIVSIIIYYFLSFIRGTKAIQMLIGLASLLILWIFAEFFKFETLSFITKGLGAVWVIIFIILFQPELRNALARLGRTRFARFFTENKSGIIAELAKASLALSERGDGGIIAIERDVGLKSYIDTGRPIEARFSSELVTTIFSPNSPLHDGAVIVKGDTIVAASCILPLSERSISYTLGTRHRAALGLAEETDAICIVISEETSKVSLAINGNLKIGLSENELKSKLSKGLE